MGKKHLHEFELRLLSGWPVNRWQHERILIAVSGGADSVALFRALIATAPHPNQLVIGHYNHKLRSQESDQDEQFVRELAQRNKISIHVGTPDGAELKLAAKGEGVESAARRLRYEFLQKTASSIGARYLTTAHTRDDLIETVLHNLMRGTGISGLAGIRNIRRISEALTLVRPLLNHSKSDICQYLKLLGQKHRIDESNDDDLYTRNRIRNRVLPLLESEFSSNVGESLFRLSRIAQDTEVVVGEYVSQIIEDSVALYSDRAEMDLNSLCNLSDPTRREVFLRIWRVQNWPQQQMSFHQWKRLSEFSANKDSGKILLPSGLVASKEKKCLEIRVGT